MVSFEVLLDGKSAARRRPAGGPGFAAPYSLTASVTLKVAGGGVLPVSFDNA